MFPLWLHGLMFKIGRVAEMSIVYPISEMKFTFFLNATDLPSAVVALSPHASAGDAEALIELDKQWGKITGPDAVSEFASPDVIVIGSDGITGIAE